MKEEAVVDDYVKAFAEHSQCDPELAQARYFKHKVTDALDNEQKESFRRYLSSLMIASNNLVRVDKFFNGYPLHDANLMSTLSLHSITRV